MEIGSEFQLIFEDLKKCDNHIFHYLEEYHTLYADSGRTAINLLSHIVGEGEILMPAYACVSVMYSFKPCVRPVYYKIDRDFIPDVKDMQEKITSGTRAVFLMSYWGRLLPREVLEQIRCLKEAYGLVIIEDTTQSIFSEASTIGDYMLCSLRKWFPIPEGGVIYSHNTLKAIDRRDILPAHIDGKAYWMAMKTMYLRGELDCLDCREACLEGFIRMEKELDARGKAQENHSMNDFTRFLLQCYDIEAMKAARKANFEYLKEHIHPAPFLEFVYKSYEEGECPFYLTLYVRERDLFREYLEERNIHSCVLWFTERTELKHFAMSTEMSRHIIQLPLDQRYGEKEMEYMADTVNRFENYKKESGLPDSGADVPLLQ